MQFIFLYNFHFTTCFHQKQVDAGGVFFYLLKIKIGWDFKPLLPDQDNACEGKLSTL
jgi:hypothetical protein